MTSTGPASNHPILKSRHRLAGGFEAPHFVVVLLDANQHVALVDVFPRGDCFLSFDRQHLANAFLKAFEVARIHGNCGALRSWPFTGHCHGG